MSFVRFFFLLQKWENSKGNKIPHYVLILIVY